MLQNVQIWYVPSSYWSICWILGVGLSGWEMFRYIQCSPARLSSCWCLVIYVRLRNVWICAVASCNGINLLMLRNSDFRLRIFHMWAVPNCKEVHFWCSRIAFTSCETFIYGWCRVTRGRFATSQESLFQAAKRSYMGNVALRGSDLVMLRNRVLRWRKDQIWSVASCKGSIYWCSGMVFSDCQT